ncbi:hypothetical protein CI238_02265 [Colletotrichum incanum]|uniref:Uncharacterized protein n=1 Tax=Colletotrichum incanum TaxID=1573173 RepID=A0A166ZIY3_COLIC|nr:hypothetical protein CI238_02265 [Colletotrichum incanum]
MVGEAEEKLSRNQAFPLREVSTWGVCLFAHLGASRVLCMLVTALKAGEDRCLSVSLPNTILRVLCVVEFFLGGPLLRLPDATAMASRHTASGHSGQVGLNTLEPARCSRFSRTPIQPVNGVQHRPNNICKLSTTGHHASSEPSAPTFSSHFPSSIFDQCRYPNSSVGTAGCDPQT